MTTTQRKRLTGLVAAALALGLSGALYFAYGAWQKSMPKTAGPVRVTAQPQTIWIEAGDTSQSLNFDFLVENLGTTPLGVDSIEVTVLDAAGKPVLRKFMDSNGFAPAIETMPGRIVAPGGKILVFNPFHSFRPDVDLHRVSYTFGLSIPQEAPEASATVTIEPRVYQGKTELSLPVKGRFMVHDGHDYYAHHRRLNTEHPAAKDLGLKQNFMRYSLDLNSTNENSDLYHGNGEFSLLGHIQKGSLAVKMGDVVKRGQLVAKMGNSGSSNNPHVHYELRSGKDLQVEGLPAIFSGYRRHLGSKVLAVAAGPLDTGDMLESH